jgi:hypothetical protein
MEVGRDSTTLTRNGRNRRKEITGKGPDLEPPGTPVVTASNHYNQCPRQTGNDEQQEEREKRPPDLGIEHGRRLYQASMRGSTTSLASLTFLMSSSDTK